MSISSFTKYLIFFLLLSFTYNASANNKVEHKIAVLVNEEMITSYDIIQRMKMNAIIKGININAQNNKLLLNNTVDDLIQEKLKKEKIEEYNIIIEDNEYKEFEIDFFERNKLNKAELKNILENNNINFNEFKLLLLSELSWNKLINGLYFRLTSVSDSEVDEIISKNPNISLNQAKNLVIQRQLDLKSSKLLRDMLNEATIEYK
ncbi:MAG: hypothetical protein CMD04_04310 [Flavobacteriales bacterium]|nr:hypothetical protein [Flavobacteriales bacterium]|tara:strand:- start:1770 stop:2384 length:615 start_codon:yes stop_codon:yes gene_type:complete